MKYTYSFEKLEVWKEAILLSKRIYQITLNFPDSEKFGLISQLRRASNSVPSNIAEGTSRITKKDKAHFTTMAYSSLMEVVNHLVLSKELGFLNNEDYESVRNDIYKISYMLNGLRKSQLRSV
ncbi:MAG: four helix bundle protein [Flavobacteriaceae bacterium]|nr:four helix bundle protein [Flavobacteriaceae bacterium]